MRCAGCFALALLLVLAAACGASLYVLAENAQASLRNATCVRAQADLTAALPVLSVEATWPAISDVHSLTLSEHAVTCTLTLDDHGAQWPASRQLGTVQLSNALGDVAAAGQRSLQVDALETNPDLLRHLFVLASSSRGQSSRVLLDCQAKVTVGMWKTLPIPLTLALPQFQLPLASLTMLPPMQFDLFSAFRSSSGGRPTTANSSHAHASCAIPLDVKALAWKNAQSALVRTAAMSFVVREAAAAVSFRVQVDALALDFAAPQTLCLSDLVHYSCMPDSLNTTADCSPQTAAQHLAYTFWQASALHVNVTADKQSFASALLGDHLVSAHKSLQWGHGEKPQPTGSPPKKAMSSVSVLPLQQRREALLLNPNGEKSHTDDEEHVYEAMVLINADDVFAASVDVEVHLLPSSESSFGIANANVSWNGDSPVKVDAEATWFVDMYPEQIHFGGTLFVEANADAYLHATSEMIVPRFIDTADAGMVFFEFINAATTKVGFINATAQGEAKTVNAVVSVDMVSQLTVARLSSHAYAANVSFAFDPNKNALWTLFSVNNDAGARYLLTNTTVHWPLFSNDAQRYAFTGTQSLAWNQGGLYIAAVSVDANMPSHSVAVGFELVDGSNNNEMMATTQANVRWNHPSPSVVAGDATLFYADQTAMVPLSVQSVFSWASDRSHINAFSNFDVSGYGTLPRTTSVTLTRQPFTSTVVAALSSGKDIQGQGTVSWDPRQWLMFNVSAWLWDVRNGATSSETSYLFYKLDQSSVSDPLNWVHAQQVIATHEVQGHPAYTYMNSEVSVSLRYQSTAFLLVSAGATLNGDGLGSRQGNFSTLTNVKINAQTHNYYATHKTSIFQQQTQLVLLSGSGKAAIAPTSKSGQAVILVSSTWLPEGTEKLSLQGNYTGSANAYSAAFDFTDFQRTSGGASGIFKNSPSAMQFSSSGLYACDGDQFAGQWHFDQSQKGNTNWVLTSAALFSHETQGQPPVVDVDAAASVAVLYDAGVFLNVNSTLRLSLDNRADDSLVTSLLQYKHNQLTTLGTVSHTTAVYRQHQPMLTLHVNGLGQSQDYVQGTGSMRLSSAWLPVDHQTLLLSAAMLNSNALSTVNVSFSDTADMAGFVNVSVNTEDSDSLQVQVALGGSAPIDNCTAEMRLDCAFSVFNNAQLWSQDTHFLLSQECQDASLPEPLADINVQASFFNGGSDLHVIVTSEVSLHNNTEVSSSTFDMELAECNGGACNYFSQLIGVQHQNQTVVYLNLDGAVVSGVSIQGSILLEHGLPPTNESYGGQFSYVMPASMDSFVTTAKQNNGDWSVDISSSWGIEQLSYWLDGTMDVDYSGNTRSVSLTSQALAPFATAQMTETFNGVLELDSHHKVNWIGADSNGLASAFYDLQYTFQDSTGSASLSMQGSSENGLDSQLAFSTVYNDKTVADIHAAVLLTGSLFSAGSSFYPCADPTYAFADACPGNNFDGWCDDGIPYTADGRPTQGYTSQCAYGTDGTDCGPRPACAFALNDAGTLYWNFSWSVAVEGAGCPRSMTTHVGYNDGLALGVANMSLICPALHAAKMHASGAKENKPSLMLVVLPGNGSVTTGLSAHVSGILELIGGFVLVVLAVMALAFIARKRASDVKVGSFTMDV